jgi:hypothetical protein
MDDEINAIWKPQIFKLDCNGVENLIEIYLKFHQILKFKEEYILGLEGRHSFIPIQKQYKLLFVSSELTQNSPPAVLVNPNWNQ